MFDEEYQEFYEEPDYETFEKKMLDLDRDAGEYDFLDNEPGEVNEPKCDLCGEPQDYADGELNDWDGETGQHYSCMKQEGIDYDYVDYV